MTEVQTETTNITDLPPADRALIVLDATKTEEHLKGLVEKAKEITEVKDKATREMAHRLAMELRTARTSIEKIGKTAREDAQAFSKAVIDTEKRLKAITAEEEARIFALRDAFDKAEEEKKAAAARAEAERIAGIQSKIDGIKALPAVSTGDSVEAIAQTIADLEALEITAEDFAEFVSDANDAKTWALGKLRELHTWTVQQDAEEKAFRAAQAKLEEDRAALAAEREALERERAELEAQRAASATPAPSDGIVGSPEYKAEQELLNAEVRGTLDAIVSDQSGVSAILIGVDMAAGDDQTIKVEIEDTIGGKVIKASEPELFDAAQPGDTISFEGSIDAADNDDATDADTIVPLLAHYTAMQFHALGRKVAAVGVGQYAAELRAIGDRLLAGEFNDALLAADWTAMGEADKDIALASHACVAMIFGEEVAGPSVLLQLEAHLQAAE